MSKSKGKVGENRFKATMQNKGYIIKDETLNPYYWDKDIDFIATSPFTGETKSIEVKWDYRISGTGNLYLELTSTHSKQWNGEGWWLHCQADVLAYGDANGNKFYMFDMAELRQRVEALPHIIKNCGKDSTGIVVSLKDVEDIYTEQPVLFGF